MNPQNRNFQNSFIACLLSVLAACNPDTSSGKPQKSEKSAAEDSIHTNQAACAPATEQALRNRDPKPEDSLKLGAASDQQIFRVGTRLGLLLKNATPESLASCCSLLSPIERELMDCKSGAGN